MLLLLLLLSPMFDSFLALSFSPRKSNYRESHNHRVEYVCKLGGKNRERGRGGGEIGIKKN